MTTSDMTLTPGIHTSVPWSHYIELPELNQSTAKQALIVDGGDVYVCPQSLKWAMDNPTEPSDAMMLGTAVHCAVLEPEQIVGRVAKYPGRRAGREWEAFKAENDGRIILTNTYHEHFVNMVRSIRTHREAAAWLAKPGETECVAVKELHGVPCKGRCDKLTDEPLVDLKTSANVTPRAFQRQMMNLGYWFQAAWYCALFDRSRFVNIVVENTPPYRVAVYEFDDEMIRYGREKVRAVLEVYKEGMRSGEWPCALGEYKMELPEWFDREDDEITIGGVAV